MTKRKAIPAWMKVQRLLDMAWKIGAANTGTDFQRAPCCRLCGDHLRVEDEIDWDHIHAVALGGVNHYTNVTPVHRKCHRKKTKADLRMIKKTRPGHTETFVVNKIGPTARPLDGENEQASLANEPGNRGTAGKPKRKWPSRPFQSRRDYLARKATQGVLK